jgi:hypothetical protein
LLQPTSIEEIINIRVEEAVEEAVQRVVDETLEKSRAEIFNLLDQGLSVEEIKQRLSYSPA